MKLLLADQTSWTPQRELKDVPILLGGVIIPTNFVVLNVEDKSDDNGKWQVLLGRPFMATAQMRIDVCKKKVMMHSFERELEIDTITCNDDLKSIGSCYVVDVQPPTSKGGRVNNLVQMYEKCSQEDENVRIILNSNSVILYLSIFSY